MAQKSKDKQNETDNKHDRSMMPMQVLWWDPCTMAVSSIWEDVCQMQTDGPFRKVCQSKKDHVVHEIED